MNGGFSANDDATNYYEDIIDQMTYGHQFIYKNKKYYKINYYNVTFYFN